MKNRTWILLFAVLLAGFVGLAVALGNRPAGHIANIYQDGVCIRSIDLAAVTARDSFPISDGHGLENIVEVEPGRIRVVSANCPDRICVETGWISDSARPIVCMPARLVIRLEPSAVEDSVDAVAG